MEHQKVKEQQQNEHYRKVLNPEKNGKPEAPFFAVVGSVSKSRIKVVFS